MEDDLTALDCAISDATVKAVLDGLGDLGKGRLTYTEMAKRQSEKFQKAWAHDYGFLSEYGAHARGKSLWTIVDQKSHKLRLGGRYDRDLFMVTCEALLSALVRTADLIARILGTEAESWKQETYPKLKAAKQWRRRIEAEVKGGEYA